MKLILSNITSGTQNWNTVFYRCTQKDLPKDSKLHLFHWFFGFVWRNLSKIADIVVKLGENNTLTVRKKRAGIMNRFYELFPWFGK